MSSLHSNQLSWGCRLTFEAVIPWQVNILASIRHPNIVLFMGVCLEPPCLVTEFCARGSLYDVLRKVFATSHALVTSQLHGSQHVGCSPPVCVCQLRRAA
jgi:serine/threonine protein kinase